jgi:hypothetical protein
MQMGTTTISSWAITGTTNQQITNTPLQSVPLKQVVGWREVF